MPFWRKSEADRSDRDSRSETAALDTRVPANRAGTHDLMPLLQATGAAGSPQPVNAVRLSDALRRIDVHFLADADSECLVAMWERHAVMFALEGPDADILMVRARAHSTVPRDFADRAYPAVNAWNHDRRFLKAYLGEPTESGQLPLYAEMQIPLVPGVHDTLLDELLGCAVDVAESWADWLHTDGAVL